MVKSSVAPRSVQFILHLLVLLQLFGLAPCFSTSTPPNPASYSCSCCDQLQAGSRRKWLQRVCGSTATVAATFCWQKVARSVTFLDSTVVLRLESPQDKAGLALMDATIGSPPRTVVAIRQIVAPSKKNRALQPGLILKEYSNAQAVMDRIRSGPYPIELEFYNLDSSNGELGEALTAQDALGLAQRLSSEPEKGPTANTPNNAYTKRTVRAVPPDACRVRSRRDDVIEIHYSAHVATLDGIIYDDSSFRGTGRPYQMVLGSGDMIPGVDQGLYDMCPGEKRVLEIPPSLAYGAKGNKMFRIPPDTRLVWEVEMVSVSTMRDLPGDDDEEE